MSDSVNSLPASPVSLLDDTLPLHHPFHCWAIPPHWAALSFINVIKLRIMDVLTHAGELFQEIENLGVYGR